MHPIIIFQSSRIVAYDLLELLAYIAFSVYMFKALTNLNIKKSQIYILIYLGFVVESLGGAVIPFLHRWIYFHQEPWLDIWRKSPGRYFHSVIISMLVFVLFISRRFKWPTKKVLDHYLIAVALGSSIGRLGCFMQGCCGGKVTNLPWGMHFPRYPNIAVHPTQLYMFFSEITLFIFLLYFYKKKKTYDGQTFWLGILLYSSYRFLVEFARTNPVFLYGLTHAQVFSMVMVAFSWAVLFYFNPSRQRGSSPPKDKAIKNPPPQNIKK